MTTTVSRFETGLAPCGKKRDGESVMTEDQQGLITEDVPLLLRVPDAPSEEFHDGSVHRMVVDHHGKVLVDEELRGE